MLRLEVFETPDAPATAAYLDPRSAEKLRDTAYEQGYGAGWQDALDQMRDEDALRRAATFEAVQALSFTYAEARAMVDSQLATVIADLLAQIVPDACALSLPARVAQELRVLLARDASAPLQVLCAPDSVPLLSPLLADLPAGARVALVAEPSFTAAQVSVQGQGQRRCIDLSSVTETLRAALSAHQPHQPHKGAHHG